MRKRVSEQFNDLLQAMVDGELTPDEQSRLQQLLKEDPDGQARLAEVEHVSKQIDELGAVDPPPFFVGRVMANLDRAGGHRKPVLTNPWMRSGGFDMTRKALWAVAGLAAIALVVFTVKGFPPVDRGTEGTIGAAQRVQAPQMTGSDVVLADADAQAFLQSEVFTQLINDPSTQKALSNPELRRLLTDQVIRRVLGDENLRKGLQSDAIRRAMDDAEVRKVLEDADVRRVLDDAAARKAFEDPAASKKALESPSLRRAFESEALRRAMGNADLRRALDNADLRRALDNADVRNALSNDALKRVLGDANMAAALKRGAFDAAIRSRGFAAALASSQFESALYSKK